MWETGGSISGEVEAVVEPVVTVVSPVIVNRGRTEIQEVQGPPQLLLSPVLLCGTGRNRGEGDRVSRSGDEHLTCCLCGRLLLLLELVVLPNEVQSDHVDKPVVYVE